MNKKAFISIVTAGALSVSMGAFAQTDMNTSEPLPDASMQTDQVFAALPEYTDFVSAIQNSDSELMELNNLAIVDPAAVQVIEVASLDPSAAPDASTIEQLVEENQEAVANVQSTIEADANLLTAIEANSVSVEDVVAVEVDENSQVIVFVQTLAAPADTGI